MIGQSLSHFQITAHLGEGGMGEVWRASDTRLGREVAVKILPDAFTREPERVARFEREARVLASLSHPNIAGIHDVGEQDGLHYLVMELAPGETLADRIAKGPIALEDAISIAGEIAEAVSAAHDQGVVHRDLKPGNVMVDPDGSVKVLDFGLAKALGPEGASGTSPELSLSPTLTFQATVAGVLLGTAAYMSPEQAKGRPVDRRSDVWSFGCVLYEMLTGKAAFAGETVAEILAAILRGEPDWEALPADLPPGVVKTLRYCLTKDRNQRLRDVTDARLLLDDALLAAEPETGRETSRGREMLAWALAGLAIIVSIAAIVGGWRGEKEPEARSVARFAVGMQEGTRLALIDQPPLAFSPDGQRVAFPSESVTGVRQLHVRDLDSLEAVPLIGTEGASAPFFSPDGEWIGFFADARLKKVPSSGGSVVPLAEAENPRGGVWTTDGSIVYSPGYTTGLWRVSAAGGEAEEVLPPDGEAGERTYRWPETFPDGRSILFTVGASDSPNHYDQASIRLWDPVSGEQSTLVDGANMARMLDRDRLLFFREMRLFVVGVDLETRSIVGTPVPVLEGVLGEPTSGAGYFAVSREGSLAYVPGTLRAERSQLKVIEAEGESRILDLEPRAFQSPRFSPDGSRLAFGIGTSSAGASGDVWTYSMISGALNRLTFDTSGIYPLWSPDGKEITFAYTSSVYAKAADGTGSARVLTGSDYQGVELPGAWSPDGRTLAITVLDRQTDIYLVTDGGEPRLFEHDASTPAFSPDGRWLVYAQPASGNATIYLRPVEGEGKWQISPGFGGYPRWPSGGDTVFYIDVSDPLRPLYAVDLLDGQSPRFGPPRVVVPDTTTATTSTAPACNWDVSPDGERFVFVELLREESAGKEFRIALGWEAQLGLSGP